MPKWQPSFFHYMAMSLKNAAAFGTYGNQAEIGVQISELPLSGRG